jgi:hypothetical protein
MKKYFCDACRKETDSLKDLSIPYHITQKDAHGNEKIAYVSLGGDRLYELVSDPLDFSISGRSQDYEVCLACHNKVFRAAFARLEEIVQENKPELVDGAGI